MIQEEKDALIKYIDDQLANMCKAVELHMDPDAVPYLYQQANEFLIDLEETTHVLCLIHAIELNPLIEKPKKLPRHPKNK